VLTRDELFSAHSLFDFVGPLLPEFCRNPDWFELESGSSDLIAWRSIQPDDTSTAAPAPKPPATAAQAGSKINLPRLRQRIEFHYPFLDAVLRNGKTTVTRLRKQFESPAENESATLFGDAGTTALTRARGIPSRPAGRLSAAAIGIAYHTFFQKLNLDRAGNEADLDSELRRLEREGHLTTEESASINISKALEFWTGDIGRRFLEHRETLWRELPFTVAFKQSELEAIAEPRTTAPRISDDLIIVQGIADLVSIREKEIWILDFKSDRLTPGELNDRVTLYRPQVQLYQRALERTCRRPVTRLWLHFLQPGRSVEISLATVR
jgi:ATP-dependent helicase/nuclease subunit A